MGEITAPHGRAGLTQSERDSNDHFRVLQVGCELIELIFWKRMSLIDRKISKGNRDLLRDNIDLLFTFSNGHRDTSPVGISAKNCGFDKRRVYYGFGNAL